MTHDVKPRAGARAIYASVKAANDAFTGNAGLDSDRGQTFACGMSIAIEYLRRISAGMPGRQSADSAMVPAHANVVRLRP